jgi:hypothetical protein
MQPNLERFLEKNRSYIVEVSNRLAMSMPEDPHVMIEHVKQLIIHRARMSALLAELDSMLDLAEKEALPEKTSKTTEMDREITKNAAVREYRMWRDILKNIVMSIDSTRSWAQSVLAYEKYGFHDLDGSGA